MHMYIWQNEKNILTFFAWKNFVKSSTYLVISLVYIRYFYEIFAKKECYVVNFRDFHTAVHFFCELHKYLAKLITQRSNY